MSASCARAGAQYGLSMIETLITIVICAFGLLAVAGLQARMQLAEVEAAQRAHAVVLVRHIADRISANRKNAMSYVTPDPVGTDDGLRDCANLTGAALDLCEWGNLLAGAAETQGNERIGAMIGARGCVFNVEPTMPRRFTIAVTWQGLTPTDAPTSTTCASDSYSDARMRRAIVAPIVLACLQNDINTGLCVTP